MLQASHSSARVAIWDGRSTSCEVEYSDHTGLEQSLARTHLIVELPLQRRGERGLSLVEKMNEEPDVAQVRGAPSVLRSEPG